MSKFKIELVNPSSVVLNLRAAAKKTGFHTGPSISSCLKDMSDRKIRRTLSGFQDIKSSDIFKLAELFKIPANWFLMDHDNFLTLLNQQIEGDPVDKEVTPIFETTQISKFKMIFTGIKSDQIVLQGGQGVFCEEINIECNEDHAYNTFEELCLRWNDNIKVQIGILLHEDLTIQTYNKERHDILNALCTKVQEIWSQVNPDIAGIIDEFNVYNETSERFMLILPTKEKELLFSLRKEIFPHKMFK